MNTVSEIEVRFGDDVIMSIDDWYEGDSITTQLDHETEQASLIGSDSVHLSAEGNTVGSFSLPVVRYFDSPEEALLFHISETEKWRNPCTRSLYFGSAEYPMAVLNWVRCVTSKAPSGKPRVIVTYDFSFSHYSE